MNWAGVQKLPVIFVLENNQYAYSTPLDQQFAVDPVERAAAYGFPGVKVDGNDPEAMFEAVRAGARARARRRGPDADRGRDHAHARPRRARRHEVRAARSKVEEWQREGPDRPPGARALEALGVDVAALREEVKADDRRRRRGGAGSRRCPTATRRTDGVFADEPALLEDGNAPWSRLQGGQRLMPTMTYLQAISDAMREEMRADERVFVMGEDIGVVRRRLQGDRRLHRRVRRPSA